MSDYEGTPLRAMRVPELINIEITSRCPLRCPQCYCDMHRGKDIDLEVALKYVEQAAELKIPYINLSGGETLVYPHLPELLTAIRDKGLHSAIAISGWGFDADKLQELKDAGVDEIYVSLNGSEKEVNEHSRQGYELALNALGILQAGQYTDYYINWVARNDNAADFPKLVQLAQSLGVKGVIVLELKPDADNVLQASLSRENFVMLAEYIKKHDRQEIAIEVEPCFSPLRAFIQQRLFVNTNTGFDKGCGAGRSNMAIDVDGNLLPCRHLLYPEAWERIEDYWWNSEVLEKLRRFEDNKKEPCRSCYLEKYCIPCRAVADKVEKDLFSGNHYCQARVAGK